MFVHRPIQVLFQFNLSCHKHRIRFAYEYKYVHDQLAAATCASPRIISEMQIIRFINSRLLDRMRERICTNTRKIRVTPRI